jgi:hypothetical protein
MADPQRQARRTRTAAPAFAKVHFGGGLLLVTAAEAAAAGLAAYPVREPVAYVKDPTIKLVKPITADWFVMYELVAQGGSLVVGAMHIYPNEGQRPAGEWSGKLAGLRATVPRGGLTARLHYQVRIGTDVGRALPAFLARMAREQPEIYAHVLELGVPTQAVKRATGGRQGRSTHAIAQVAATYARAVERGSRRPVLDAADESGLDRRVVRNIIHTARQLHYLTATPKGRQGGVLTPAGQQAAQRRPPARTRRRKTA